MNKRRLSILMYVLSAIALGIAVYQFIGARLAECALSVVFVLVFLIGAIGNQRVAQRNSNR